jgi:cysteine desulfurase/selenocysteine lyase
LIGGSTVQDVKLDSYELIEDGNEIYARIEPGLQNYAGIIGLNRALKWLNEPFKMPPTESQNLNIPNIKTKRDWEKYLSDYLHQKLKEVPNITLLNQNPSAIVSLYSDKIDAHKLAMYLSEAGIMCRSGYHCCHYYLKEKSKLPPLFRISLGLNNSPAQIDFLIKNLKTLCSV